MTRAMRVTAFEIDAPRVLRVGVLRDGRIEAERTFRDPTEVTVGRDERCAIVAREVASRQVLLSRQGDRWVLHLTAAMRGRVALRDGVATLEALSAAGHTRVVLDATARGKIDFGGGTTLLFQMVVPPPRVARPQLPAAVRGGLLAGVDWAFTCIATVSFMVFGAATLYLESADFALAADAAEIPEWVEMIVLEPPPPPPERPERLETAADVPPDPSPTDVEPSTAPTDGTRRPEPTDGTRPTVRPAEPAPSLADYERAQQAAHLLIGALTEASGTAFDNLRSGAPTTGQAELFEQINGTVVASSDSTRLRDRNGCGPGGTLCAPSGTLRDLVPRGTEEAHRRIETDVITETRVRRPIGVSLDPISEPTGPGWFDAAVVTGQVRRRVGPIRRCYERELTRRPDLSGKITMAFSIQPAGHVTGVRAIEDTVGSPTLVTCIAGALRSLRFHPGPEGGPAHFTYPFVFTPQG